MNNNQFTKKDRFGIRKFSVGVGSALLTSLLFLGISHSANAAEDEIELNLDNPEESTIPAATTPANNGNTASDGVDPYAPTSEHSAEIDNQDPNTITNTYDGKNEMDPTPGSQGTSPLEYDGNHEMTPTPGKQGTSPLEYDGSHEMTPTPGKQGTSPLEYDGSHEMTPIPGKQGTSPLEYDGSHEMTPTPGKQGTSPLEYDG
ncbi:YSIRK-type signal peptide-containing protein, partial [Staphylococcus argensis]